MSMFKKTEVKESTTIGENLKDKIKEISAQMEKDKKTENNTDKK